MLDEQGLILVQTEIFLIPNMYALTLRTTHTFLLILLITGAGMK